ncbi:hypothetical protein [Micromonospora pallida]|uniref:hypothetical protein n=1 Tax=Micromonospora pallida TaxID=145854 RepID=UPI00159EFEC8
MLYYSLPAKGKNGQRCIGVADADDVRGRYEPLGDAPLICPADSRGADDAVPGRPVAAAGVIDPAPFQDAEGRRFVLYKTQQTPSTIRMLRVNDDGTRWIGNASRELAAPTRAGSRPTARSQPVPAGRSTPRSCAGTAPRPGSACSSDDAANFRVRLRTYIWMANVATTPLWSDFVPPTML